MQHVIIEGVMFDISSKSSSDWANSIGTAFQNNRWTKFNEFATVFINVHNIPANGFQNTAKIEINLSNITGTVGLYAFYNSRIEEVELPEGCYEIGNEWVRLSDVKKVILPSTISAFVGRYGRHFHSKSSAGSSVLKTIVIKATDPPSVTSASFSEISTSAKFYVPDESVDAYKTAQYWSSHASKIHPMSEYAG